MGKQNLEEKMYLRKLSGSKFNSVTSSNVILYNDIKNLNFHQKWIYQVLEINSSIEKLREELSRNEVGRTAISWSLLSLCGNYGMYVAVMG